MINTHNSPSLSYTSLGEHSNDDDSDDEENELLIAQPPDLAVLLYNDLQVSDLTSNGLWKEKILRVSSIVLATTGFYFGTALFFRPSSSINNFPLRVTSQIGSIAAGIFPFYYWIKLGTDWTHLRPEEEMRLRLKFRCRPLRIIKNIGDYAWGILTQFPMAEVAMKYNQSSAATIEALITVITNASPTIESSAQLSSFIENGGRYLLQRFSKDPNRVALLKTHAFMLEKMKRNIQLGLSMTMEERIQRFQILYHTEAERERSQLATVRKLCKTLLLEQSTDHLYRIDKPCWHVSISWIVRILMGCITAVCADFIQTGGMTRDSAHLITQNKSATDFLITVVVISWLYLSIVSPGNAAVKIYGQMTDLAGVPRERSFSEIYYSKVSKLSDALSVALSWMMIGENYLIAEPYFNRDSVVGRILLVSSVVGCTGYFMDSMSQLAERAIETFARSRFSSEEARHALLFKQKCERIRDVLKEVSLPDLQQLFDWIDDSELTDELRKRLFTSQELVDMSLNQV